MQLKPIYLTNNGKLVRVGGKFLSYDPRKLIDWQSAIGSDFSTVLYNTYSGYVGTKEYLLIPIYLTDARQTGMKLSKGSGNTTVLKAVKFADDDNDHSKLRTVKITYPTLEYIVLPSTVTSLEINGLTEDVVIEGADDLSGLTSYKILNTSGLTKIPQVDTSAPIATMSFAGNTALVDASDFVWPLAYVGGRALFQDCSNLEYTSITVNQTASLDMSLMFSGTKVHDVLVTADNLRNTKWVQRYLTIRIPSTTQTYAFWREAMAAEAMPNNVNQFHPYIKPTDRSGRQILIWGDSLTRMTNGGEMPKKLLSMVASDVIVNNKGVAGITTEQMVSNFTTYMTKTTQTDKYVDSGANDDINILFLGHNAGINISSYDESYMPWLTGKNYVVSGLVQKSWSVASDASLASHYGGHYYNLHQYMVDNGFALTGLTPTATDEADIQAGKVPHSFLQSDYVHLNEWGAQIVAFGYLTALLDMGYIDQTWLSDAGKNTSVTLSSTAETVAVGSTVTLTAASGNGADIEWKSTNESIATVEGGVVTGVASGSCKVIARCGGYSKTCAITVSGA